MKILRKIALVALAGAALTSSAYADGQFGLGVNYSSLLIDFGGHFGAEFTYLNNNFLLSAGGSYQKLSDDNFAGGSANSTTVNLLAALRSPLKNNINFDYGVLGAYGFISDKSSAGAHTKNPYALGAYVGFDFTINQNMLLTAGVEPYAYQKNFFGGHQNTFFSTGKIGFSYLF